MISLLLRLHSPGAKLAERVCLSLSIAKWNYGFTLETTAKPDDSAGFSKK
jgi:hypothetical protein